ncbi:DUF2637 domain-containing protein [Streptomyces sp. MI02-7b]|uniref:DUF2637 domain-containing protein n=1 Tax=Streptomyces sp. MI02-7b TaxID=462941 RepID=UPI0029AAE2CA|nr:DUF2637 domain-containing protein [Streptomyces sp. MI02-7b]MDX3074604.1 DUF2637 domain-containing protein [Streptomyces sp. MI02-7b]
MATEQRTHAPTTPGNPRAIGLAIGAAIIITGITGIAFWLSYYHLHDVAAAHGLHTDPARAWAWPAVLDLFYLAGELLILRASWLRTVDPWAIALTTLGAAGSIGLNVAGVGGQAPALDYVVAAVPPVAALLAFGALMQQIHRHFGRAVASPVVAPSPQTSVPVVEQVIAPPPPVAPPAVPAVSTAVAAELPPVEEQREPLVYADPRCHAIRPLYDGGYRPGTATMRQALIDHGHGRVGDSTIRGTLRAEVERHEPHLAALPAEASPLPRRTG